MSEGLAEQGYSVSLMEVEQLVARLDLDADGHIQMDEFAASMIDWKVVSTNFHFCLDLFSGCSLCYQTVSSIVVPGQNRQHKQI